MLPHRFADDADADQEQEKQAEQAGSKQEQDTADGKGDAAGDAAVQEPDPKRQATEAKKAELEADAPIGGGAKPSGEIEEGRIYFIYRCCGPDAVSHIIHAELVPSSEGACANWW